MQTEAFQQDLDPALALPALRAAFDARRPHAHAALRDWLASQDPRVRAFRRSLERDDDLAPADAIVQHLRNDAKDIVVLGTGGSSLGAQAIAQLSFWGTPGASAARATPRLHMFDNLDGHTFRHFLRSVDLRTTRFHVVSKSGGTAEPLLHMLAAIGAIEAAGGGKRLKLHFSGEAEPGRNPVRILLEDMGSPVLAHDPDLGGRYTAFSTVGLVPAMLAGVDARAFREAGLRACAAAAAGDVTAADGAALAVAAHDAGLSQQVMWNYADRLERFAKWWRQLWAESLGKSGHGTTPIDALGPVDQHSQLQLYLDGPADKLFTLISLPRTQTLAASSDWANKAGLSAFAARDLSDVAFAQARATAESLRRGGRPVRTLHLRHGLDEKALAALMVHFILETLVAARLWNVDPFGQPAVEDGKKLTMQYLEDGR
ncbi:MAG: glucose-6-phosphate isomerase [Alphaproteobacteria bacterium]